MSREANSKSVVVINIVGLTQSLMGEHTPNLMRLANEGACQNMRGVFPAVTTTAQSSMLTGLPPSEHGIVGNGWYFRDQAEVRFWLQPNQLVQGEKIWHQLKRDHGDFTTSMLFWWYNMYADVEHSVTPRPHYPADGSKVMDLYSHPVGLHQSIESRIGVFPFFNFWGPASDIRSSRWIVDCAIDEYKLHRPNLQLVYLPHLDYNLQRLGPDHPDIAQDLQAIDHEAGRLIDFARGQGSEVVVVSEYGISPVSRSIAVNQILREAGYLAVRESVTWELLDSGASRAFAVADHQCAHVYIQRESDIAEIKKLLYKVEGIDRVLDRTEQQDFGINHHRSGELVLIAEPDTWFNYYYWLDNNKAPDFARTVDIHRKPGYDPVELFIDPDLRFPKLRIARRVLQKKLGQRMLMDVIPIKPELVKGSHGRLADHAEDGPVLITSRTSNLPALHQQTFDMRQICQLLRQHFD
jgi:predicted AlkP superfamily pyrophosphatase or phosphodiesterase